MRKYLHILALAALAFQIGITFIAIYGAHRLPDRIPIHFDHQGQPNGWGSPTGLPLLPAVAVGVYLLLTVVARFPAAFNYPIAVNETNRGPLQALALDLLAWLRMEIPLLLAALQWICIQAARHPQGGFSPRFGVLVLGPMALLLGTIGWYIAAMFRVPGEEAAE